MRIREDCCAVVQVGDGAGRRGGRGEEVLAIIVFRFNWSLGLLRHHFLIS